jgi:tyrosine-protein phosphatase YwqE
MGRRAQECGLELIQMGLAHLIASDAHHASVREVGMAAATDAVGGGELAQWLTLDVPSAILADELPPPRPQGGTSGGWLGRLFGS